MEELTIPKPGPLVVELVLVNTTVPQEVLLKMYPGKVLVLPTYATLSVIGDSLSIKVTVRNPENDRWQDTWNNTDLQTIKFELPKQDILHLRTGDAWRSDEFSDYQGRHRIEYPAAVLTIRDPLEIDDELHFTFASTDTNNPGYWIKVLGKLIYEELKVNDR